RRPPPTPPFPYTTLFRSAGILPRALAAVHPRFKTPYVAVHVQGALGIAIAVILGFALSSPLNAFALLGTMVTLIVVVIYILTNLDRKSTRLKSSHLVISY